MDIRYILSKHGFIQKPNDEYTLIQKNAEFNLSREFRINERYLCRTYEIYTGDFKLSGTIYTSNPNHFLQVLTRLLSEFSEHNSEEVAGL